MVPTKKVVCMDPKVHVMVTLLRFRLNNRKSIESRKIDPSNKITFREGWKWKIVSLLEKYFISERAITVLSLEFMSQKRIENY